MATGTLSSPVISSNGYQATFTVTGGTWSGTLSLASATAIAFSLTSEGYTGSSLGTRSRTVYASGTPTYSGGTITVQLSHPIFNDDSSITVTCSASAITNGTDVTAALGSTSCTQNSTLDYLPASAAHFATAPHQRYTGSVTVEVATIHQFGVAAVEMGITQATTLVTNGSGITGTYTYPEAITFSGGATGYLCPGSALSGSGSAKTMLVFVRSGTVAAAETMTGSSSGATCVISTVSAGEDLSSVQTTQSTATREGSYGPATTYDIWSATLNPSYVGPYERWFKVYPYIGDADAITASRSFTVRATKTTLTGEISRGENEIYCDPGDTLASSQKSYYVDNTSSAAANSYSGTFTAFEYCSVKTSGTLSAVVCAIGDSSDGTQTATPFRYNALPYGSVAYTMTLGSAPTGGNPAYGNIMTVTGTWASPNKCGFVLAYDSGTKVLTYLSTSATNFANLDAITLRDADAVSLGITFTAATPSSAVGSTVSSGDVIVGYSSGATCTLTGAPAANGSNSNTGTSLSPFATMRKAFVQAATDRGDGLADGVTVYLKRGQHRHLYTAGTAEIRYYWGTITRAPGTEIDNVRITRFDTTANTNGNDVNFEKWEGVTFWQTFATTSQLLTINGNNTGNFDCYSCWIKDCSIKGDFRWQRSSPWPIYNTNGPIYSLVQNCSTTRCVCAAHAYRDYQTTIISDDVLTQASLALNVTISDVSATGTDYHSDIFQLQVAEGGNRLLWNLEAKTLDFVAIAPFFNNSSGTSSGYAFVNMLQGTDGTSNQAYVGAASSATASISNMMWAFCSQSDNLIWAAQSGATLNLATILLANSVFGSITSDTTGTIATLRPGFMRENHIVTAPSAPVVVGYRATTGSSIAALCDSATETNAAWFRPTAGGTLTDRTETLIPGWPKYDIYGNKRSTSFGAIGARVPTDEFPIAGTISEVSSTSTTIALSATSPSGGYGSYTYQWYYGNSSLAEGEGVTFGTSALTATATGLTADTTYYFRLMVTDSVGNVSYSSQYSASTQADSYDIVKIIESEDMRVYGRIIYGSSRSSRFGNLTNGPKTVLVSGIRDFPDKRHDGYYDIR